MRHAVKASPRHSGASRDVNQSIIKTLFTYVSMHHQRHNLDMSHCIIKTGVKTQVQLLCNTLACMIKTWWRMSRRPVTAGKERCTTKAHQARCVVCMHDALYACTMRRMHRRGTAFDDTKETSDGPTRQSVAWNPSQSMYTLRRARRWSSGERCAGSASEPCEAHAMP